MRIQFAGMNTLSDPASIDALNPKSKQYGQCIDICNCDLDDENNAISRDGFTLIAAGNITSAWTSTTGITYCISNGKICTFDGSAVTVLEPDLPVDPVCEFAQVNDIVVFSDNTQIGLIEGNDVSLVSHPSDWLDVADLEQWVTDHYPADPATASSNFVIDAFKLTTLAGRCLDFFNGALYLAVDNFVYCTKTHDIEHMDIRYNVVAGFASAVTMITHVADGLYVGTADGVFFLEGGGLVVDETYKVLAGFSQRQVLSVGAIYGTDVHNVDAGHIPHLQTTGMVSLWSTRLGICAGLPGGAVINLSAEKLTLPDVAQGTAVVQILNNTWQYKVCFDTSPTLFISNNSTINTANLNDTWVLNLNNATHSHFTRYPFNSLFTRGSEHYGSNKLGIFRFGGDTDFTGVTALAQTVTAFILTPLFDFGKRQLKYHLALYVQARCDGELEVDYIVDESVEYANDVITFDGSSAAHARRAAPPKGIKGTLWQYKLTNVDGSRFTAFNLEPVIAVSANRTK